MNTKDPLDITEKKIENLTKMLNEAILERDILIAIKTNIQPEWFQEHTMYFIFNDMGIDRITFSFDKTSGYIESRITRFLESNQHNDWGYKTFRVTTQTTREQYDQWLEDEFGERDYRCRTHTTKENAIAYLTNLRSNYISKAL